MTGSRHFLFFVLLLLPAAGAAQPTPDSVRTVPPADSLAPAWDAELPELTVTATRVPTSAAEAPVRVARYDSAALQQTAAASVGDLLRDRAGLYVRQYGAGGLQTVSLRGTGASQTLVLLDGHRIADPQLGQLDLSLLPTVLLQSVEVMHGPASPLYGSDGMGGAVHLRSLRPRDDFHARAASYAGAFGERGGSVLAGGGSGTTSVVVAAERRHTDGDFPYVDEALFPARTVRRKNADRDRWTLYSAVRSRAGRHRLQGGVWVTGAERGLPDASATGTNSARQWDTQLRLWADDRIPTDWGSVSVGGLVQHTRLRYADPAADLDDTGRTWRTALQAEVRRPLSSRWLLTTGGTAAFATARHPSLSADAQEMASGAFAAATGTYGRMRWYPALRLDAVAAPAAPSRVALSPRLGLNVQPVSRWDALHLKAHVARAFRTPTFNERYWEPGGNPDLRPEHGWSADAGLRLDRPSGFVEATAFTNRRTDQIVWAPNAQGVWSPSNVQRTRTLGWELAAERTWRLASFVSVDGGLTYTYTDARNRSTPGAASFNQPLRYVPRDQMKLHVTPAVGPVALDLHVRYTGRRYTTTDASDALDAYVIAGAQLRVQHRFSTVRTHLALQIDNLLDADYRVVNNHPMPPRHARVRLSLEF